MIFAMMSRCCQQRRQIENPIHSPSCNTMTTFSREHRPHGRAESPVSTSRTIAPAQVVLAPPAFFTVCFLAFAPAFFPSAAGCAEIGHFNGGFLNIRDYLVPEKGVYGGMYTYLYTTDRLNDGSGEEVGSIPAAPRGGQGLTPEVDVDVDIFVLAPTFIYATELPSLAIRYAGLISPTFADASLEAALSLATGQGGLVDSSSLGIGDMFVQPVWLGKPLDHWDLSLAYGFYAPIGKYATETLTLPGGASVTTEAKDNIGYGFWTHQIQGAVAWYPWTDRRMAVVSALTYEIHDSKEDFDLTPGDNFTVNWGVSQFLPLQEDKSLLLEVGVAGYHSWQVSDDSGRDAADPGVHDQVHAIGLQLGFAHLPWQTVMNVHGFYEYEAKDRFQGLSCGLNLTKKF